MVTIRPEFRRVVGWGLLFLASAYVLRATYYVLLSAIPRYLTITADSYGVHFWPRRPWILVHVMVGSLTVVLGLMQFWPWLRNRHRRVHRYLGRAYVTAVAVAGAASLVLGVRAEVSIGNTAGLTLMGLAWLVVTWIAFQHARNRRFVLHAVWMSRSYVLTLAFVVFRIGDNYLERFGIVEDPVARLTLLAWVCWLGPLLLLEIFRHVVPGPGFLAVRRATSKRDSAP